MAGAVATKVFPTRRFWPARYFISHSYQDKAAREHLISLLPKGIRPFVFQPIKVTPDQRVSDDLVKAVSRSHGLVYLEGGASAESFWVAFERRMALRARKPVVAFNPATGVFSRPVTKLVDPPCAFMWNGFGSGDTEIVHGAAKWLLEKRGLDLSAARNRKLTSAGVLDLKDSMYSLNDKMRAGGVIVLFLSAEALEDPEFYELREGGTRSYLINEGILASAVLIVWTRRPDTERLRRALGTHWWKPDLAPLKAAILASLSEENGRAPVILTENGRLDWRRVDDLMVRVDYMVFKRDGIGRLWPEQPVEVLSHREDMRSRPVSDRPGTL
jgi:hypothetical protein